ncbi:hypothetical protein DPEC_G00059200 [Dallia pectoralis]|uniref:Uncharacterized protein n=1 Tax=Dallia pectoralis TaxID=75939 RepID=A0ACC2H6B5_DALPE|nr:hypothetical protein DPEC_G00059200 [Dallia pectoralis]
METLMYFCIFILLTLFHQAVSSIFVEKGRDVQLDVPEYEIYKEEIASLSTLYWTFNSTNVVIHDTRGTQVSTKYKGRVKFSKENLSLLLKNIQEGDSGRYSAVLSGEIDITIAEHLISVQVRVEPPVLTVDSSTDGTCNVTCKSQKTTVTSSCNNICSQVGVEVNWVETSSASLLSVYVTEGTIICNHSNQVSWSNHTKRIESICVPELNGKPDPPTNGKSLTVILVPIILAILVIVGIITFFFLRNRNRSVLTNQEYSYRESQQQIENPTS